MEDIKFFTLAEDESGFPTPENLIDKFISLHNEMGIDGADMLDQSMDSLMANTALAFDAQYVEVENGTYVFFPHDIPIDEAVVVYKNQNRIEF